MNKYEPRVFPGDSKWFSLQIYISGSAGVRTSTCLEELKKFYQRARLPCECFSGGALMRKRAAELGFTMEKFADHLRKNPGSGHDKWLDDETAKCSRYNHTILEARLSHVFMPRAFHVLLICDIDVCARRKSGQSRGSRFLKFRRDLEKRDNDDTSRFARLYPGCLWPNSAFNVVIDTKHVSLDDEIKRIVAEHQKWVAKIPKRNLLTEDDVIEG